MTITYSWVSTGSFSACSADCGGSQQQLYACQSSLGLTVDGSLCTGNAPIVSQVCDGNPSAVATSQADVTTEQSGQALSCPANQVGTVTQERQVTTTTTYACVNHQIAVASTQVSDGAWVTNSNCQEQSTYRCSQDQLSPEQAMARYRWMLKCESKLSEIHDFINSIDRYLDMGREHGMCEDSRAVYATFMVKQSSCGDKVWVAPFDDKADCKMPTGVYVAAECGVGGVTAGQSILAATHHTRMDFTPIEHANDEDFRAVATLFRAPWFFGPLVVRTPVERWITQDKDESHPVLNFVTESKRQITVTPAHGMLDVNGYLRPARDFKVGDHLVLVDGRFDRIRSIKAQTYQGKIYNVLTRRDDDSRNVVATNGFLNATANHQQEGVRFVNRRLLQRRFGQGVCR